MPPKKRIRSLKDPLNSLLPHTVIIKQEVDDDFTNFVSESFDCDESKSTEQEESNSDQDECEYQKQASKKIKRKKYRKEDLEKAGELVLEGKMSTYKAAKLFSIPKSTIGNYVQNKRENRPRKKTGMPSVLTQTEEQEIIEWVKAAADLGVCRFKEDLPQAAADILKLNKRPGFKNELPTEMWTKRFLLKHSALDVRNFKDVTDERNFFNRFYKFLDKNNLLDTLQRPDAFYVMEDANFELNSYDNSKNRSMLSKALARNGINANYFRKKKSVTVTYCFGADGRKLQELVIFNEDFKDMVKVAMLDKEMDSKFLFTRTKTSGHTRESFKCYLQRLDAQLKDIKRPIFIFCKETLPQVGIDLYRWCREREIFIISFIPKYLSVLEECDKGIFSIDNSGWRNEIDKNNTGRNINEIEFIRLLKSVNDRVFEKYKIIEFFKSIKIFPFDTSNIDEDYEKLDLKVKEQSRENSEVAEMSENSRNGDKVVLQHLKKMKEMNEQLKLLLGVKSLDHLSKHSLIIDEQIKAISTSV